MYIHIYTYIYIHTCIYIHSPHRCTHMYMYMNIYMCVYIYRFKYIYGSNTIDDQNEKQERNQLFHTRTCLTHWKAQRKLVSHGPPTRAHALRCYRSGPTVLLLAYNHILISHAPKHVRQVKEHAHTPAVLLSDDKKTSDSAKSLCCTALEPASTALKLRTLRLDGDGGWNPAAKAFWVDSEEVGLVRLRETFTEGETHVQIYVTAFMLVKRARVS